MWKVMDYMVFPIFKALNIFELYVEGHGLHGFSQFLLFENNGIFVLLVGFFFLQTNFDFLTNHF